MYAILWDPASVSIDRGAIFREACDSLMGLPVSWVWRGYGSAVFFELGRLELRNRRDGSPGNPRGEWTLSIEWSWRIEGKRRIWCGSWSDEDRWPRFFELLRGAHIVSADLVGRLPEIDVGLSNKLHVVSMMTAEGDPEWSLTNNVGTESFSLSVRAGRLCRDWNPA